MSYYHLTWRKNLRSILKKGLIPNYRPNKWVISQERCKGRTFLCNHRRIGIWRCYLDGIRIDKSEIVCIKINCTSVKLNPDKEYDGDFFTNQVIQPELLEILKFDGIKSWQVELSKDTSSKTTIKALYRKKSLLKVGLMLPPTKQPLKQKPICRFSQVNRKHRQQA